MEGKEEGSGCVSASAKQNGVGNSMLELSAIEIGPRFRRDLGDVDGLAQSIADIGLLHPVVVDNKFRLIAGARRLEACRRLGWNEVPVRIVSLAQIIRGEFAENRVRKDFLPTETVAIEDAIAPLERAAAKKRKAHGGRAGKLPERSRTRDNIAQYAGVSGRTLEKAKAVVKAAQKNPSLVGLVEEMDRTGNVDRAFRKIHPEPEKPVSLPFTKAHADAIVDGNKTQTARRSKRGLAIGKIVRVQVTHYADIEITDIEARRLEAFTEEDAEREGGYTLEQFKQVWREIHGEWNPNQQVYAIQFVLRKVIGDVD